MRRALGVAGSLRRGSYNRMLLHAAAAASPAALALDVDDGLAAIPMFDEDRECDPAYHAAVGALCERVMAADGLVIATPEYNQSIPGVLKNALDWLSRGDAMAGKPVAILGATSGRWGTRLAQSALRQVLAAMAARVMPAPALYVDAAGTRFASDGALSDPALAGGLRDFLAAFARWIESARAAG